MSLIKRDNSSATRSRSPFDSLRKAAKGALTSRKGLRLYVDKSSSMDGEPIRDASRAASEVYDKYSGRVTISMGAFGGSFRMLLRADLDELRAGGGTPMHLAIDDLLASPEGSQAILMSDGCPNSAREVTNRVKQCVGRYVIHTVACGDYADEDLLRGIAAMTGGTFYHAAQSIDLPKAFEALASKAVAMLTAGSAIACDESK